MYWTSCLETECDRNDKNHEKNEAPVTSWNGLVWISFPEAATPMMTDCPQPLCVHSNACLITSTLPMHSKEWSTPPKPSSVVMSMIVSCITCNVSSAWRMWILFWIKTTARYHNRSHSLYVSKANSWILLNRLTWEVSSSLKQYPRSKLIHIDQVWNHAPLWLAFKTNDDDTPWFKVWKWCIWRCIHFCTMPNNIVKHRWGWPKLLKEKFSTCMPN